MSRCIPGRKGIYSRRLPGGEAYHSWITHWLAVILVSLDKKGFRRRRLRRLGLWDPLVDSEGVLVRITFSLLLILGATSTAP